VNHIVRERRLINVWIVRASVTLCVIFIVLGLALFFAHGSRMPAMPSGSVPHILHDILLSGSHWQASAFLDAGLLVILLTPMVRLLAGVYVSLRMRDWLYASIGLIVVALVIIGLVAGQAGV
jgi:uncharacterized membrane protein